MLDPDAMARQELRYALADTLGSTTGAPALAAIHAATGRRTLVVFLEPRERRAVMTYLKAKEAGKEGKRA